MPRNFTRRATAEPAAGQTWTMAASGFGGGDMRIRFVLTGVDGQTAHYQVERSGRVGSVRVSTLRMGRRGARLEAA